MWFETVTLNIKKLLNYIHKSKIPVMTLFCLLFDRILFTIRNYICSSYQIKSHYECLYQVLCAHWDHISGPNSALFIFPKTAGKLYTH